MNKSLIAALGVAVIGAVVYLLISSRGNHSEAKSSPSVRDLGGESAPGTSADTPPRPLPPDRPELAVTDDGERELPQVREHVRPDGTVVRDHRTGVAERDPNVPIARPSEHAPISTKPVHDLRIATMPEVKQCIRDHESELGPRARAQMVIKVAVESEVLSVVKADVQTQDIPDDSGFSDCLSRAWQGHTVPAAGDDDVEHTLTYQIPLPGRPTTN